MPKTLWCWPLVVWFHCTWSRGSSRYHIWWLLLTHHPDYTRYLLQGCTAWRSYSLYCSPWYEFQYLLFLHNLFHNGRSRADRSSWTVPCHSFPNYLEQSTTGIGGHSLWDNSAFVASDRALPSLAVPLRNDNHSLSLSLVICRGQLPLINCTFSSAEKRPLVEDLWNTP